MQMMSTAILQSLELRHFTTTHTVLGLYVHYEYKLKLVKPSIMNNFYCHYNVTVEIVDIGCRMYGNTQKAECSRYELSVSKQANPANKPGPLLYLFIRIRQESNNSLKYNTIYHQAMG